MTQTERVLRALQTHPAGVCAVDFLPPDVIDGGAPILRLGARIYDLRGQGHNITKAGTRHRTDVYRLEAQATLFDAA